MSMYNDSEYTRLKSLRVELKDKVSDHYGIEGMMNCGMICVGSMSLEEVAMPAAFVPDNGAWMTEGQHDLLVRTYNEAPRFEEAMSRILGSLLARMNENGMIVMSDSIQEPLGGEGGDFREIGIRHLAEYIMRNSPDLLQQGPCVWNNGGDGFIQHWTIMCSKDRYDDYEELLADNCRREYNEREEDEEDDEYY